jgi:hypothetical protein
MGKLWHTPNLAPGGSSININSNKNVNSNNFNFRSKSPETTRNREFSKMLISRFLVVSRDFDCFVGIYVFVGVYGCTGNEIITAICDFRFYKGV